MRAWTVPMLLVALVACEREAPPLPPAEGTYSTRGVVERMQTRDDDHLMILHEDIEEFVGADGEAAPMGSMTMPFAVAEGVSLDGVGVGSKLAFTFEVRWTGPTPLLVTKLDLLPPDTKLDVAG